MRGYCGALNFRIHFRALGVMFVALAMQGCLQNSLNQTQSANQPRGGPNPQALAIDQFRLGKSYLSAGLEKEALGWFEDAANKGLSQAQYALSVMHKDGVGTPRNDAKAFYWAEKAAENGDPYAQDLLGTFYATGLGVARNYSVAAHWFRKSTEGGYVGAATKLAALYYAGQGVPRDLEQASDWASKDAVKSHLPAMDLLDRIEQSKATASTVPPPRITVERGVSSDPVPRSAGYTKKFEALHNRSMADSAEIVAALEPKIMTLPPPYLFEMARRTFEADKQESMTWFWLGVVRSRYDAARCTDRTSRQGVLYLPQLAPRVAKAMKEEKQLSSNAAATALERERDFPANSNPYWICIHGINAVQAALNNTPLKDWQIGKEHWSEIRTKLRSSLRKVAEAH